jgi:pimeloyl-ACP methyl ester carboxylesterase
MPPTIVLVHGAFAESSNWDAVIDLLLDGGHPVIAAANPLRGIANDAAAVTDVVRAVDGPIVLAAHSYGGAVISNVPADAGEIVGLVYIDAFAPDAGESCFALAGKFPAACSARRRSVRSRTTDGTTDLFIIQDRFHEVFCADLPAPQAARMVVTQRPGTREGLVEPSGPCGSRCRRGSSSETAIASSRRPFSATWPSGLKLIRCLRSRGLPTPARSPTRARPRV